MPSPYEHLLVERDGPIAVVTLNRPDKLNALNRSVLEQLIDAFVALSAPDAGVRVAILTGAGDRAFAAGADIAAMRIMSAAEAREFSELGHRACALVEEAPFPVIAAVHGYALGGGCEIALACDFIYAAENTKLGQPEINVGITPGFGGTQRLARRIGVGRTRELVYTGSSISASEALSLRLVNAVVPGSELQARVREVARTIASKAPLAVAASKRAILRGTDVDLTTGNELEMFAFASMFGTDDQREGATAFLEKRAPVFRGR